MNCYVPPIAALYNQAHIPHADDEVASSRLQPQSAC